MRKFVFHASPRPLPAVSFRTGDGGRRTLRDWHGRVILLALWASWCAPCREEIPSLDRLNRRLGGPDFEVVSLSIDKGGITVARDAMAAWGVRSLDVHWDEAGKAAAALGVPGVPTTLLIDREGRELGRLQGTTTWDGDDAVLLVRAISREGVEATGDDRRR